MPRILNSEEQYRHMMETPIPRLVTSLAIPTTVSMLVTVIYNTADTYFVSQINKSASAAVGMVYTLMAIIQAVGYGLGMGAGSLISRKLGEKNDSAADMYASSAFFAAVGRCRRLGLPCGARPDTPSAQMHRHDAAVCRRVRKIYSCRRAAKLRFVRAQ